MNLPRYHLDVVDGITIGDEGGADASDDIMAADIADGIAQRLS